MSPFTGKPRVDVISPIKRRISVIRKNLCFLCDFFRESDAGLWCFDSCDSNNITQTIVNVPVYRKLKAQTIDFVTE